MRATKHTVVLVAVYSFLMITTKKQNYELYERGLYGNKLRTWDNIECFRNSKYNGTVTIRYKGKNGGSFCAYNVQNVDEKINEFIKSGAKIELFAFNESAPDDKLVLQGEFTHNESGYQLFYSTEKGKMRDCLKNGKSLSGLSAKLFLQSYLNSNSFSDIMELIDLYPNHVIEFSAYAMNLGCCRYRNAVIWEVRLY